MRQSVALSKSSGCHLEGIEENVVLIDSVSKRYSECGIRIGALITKNKEVRNAVMKFCQARLSPPLIGQIAAEASLDAPEDQRLAASVTAVNHAINLFQPVFCPSLHTEIIKYQPRN